MARDVGRLFVSAVDDFLGKREDSSWQDKNICEQSE